MVVRIVSIDSSLGSSLLVADAGPGTAGTALSVLSRAEQSSPRRHAESLGAMLARVLAAPGVADHPLDAVIAATGPAPFTGLRAGLVTALARLRPTTLLTLGTAGAGAAMVLLSLRVWPWWAATTGFAVFASLALCNAGAETLVRLSTDDDHQARVWGTISLVSQLGYLLAYLSAGPLADRLLAPLMEPDGALATSMRSGIWRRSSSTWETMPTVRPPA